MVVVDEQHRFGVEQRDRLRAKAPAGITPHLLVMTATPIPRTVALTVYGDLETSTLRELPRGRQPIATNAIFVTDKPAWLDRAWQRIIEEVAAGRQAYVVALAHRRDRQAGGQEQGPRCKARRRPSSSCSSGCGTGQLAGLRLGLMHGRLTADEKDAVMAAFRGGRDRRAGVHHRHRGRRRRAQRHRDVRDGRRPVRHQPAASAAWPHRPRRAPQPVPAGHRAAARSPRPGSGSRRSPARWTVSNSPTSTSQERREGDVLGRTSPAGAITLRLLSLADHREIIEAARAFCEARLRRDPAGTRDWRCWRRHSPTPSASSTWTSREPQDAGCGWRRRRCSPCWCRTRRWSASAERSARVRRARRRARPWRRVSTCWPASPWCRCGSHGYDYRRAAFGDAWTDDNDAPGGHNGCDTRNDILDRDLVDKTYVVDQAVPRRGGDRHPARPVHQRHHRVRRAATRSARRCRSTTSCRWRWPGTWAPATGPTRCGCGSPTTRPTCSPCRAGQSGQGRLPARAVDAAQRRVLVPVRDAVHRGVARLRAARSTRRRPMVLREAAATCPTG